MRCQKGVFDFGHVAEKYTVKQGGCSSCPVRCYTEYEMDPLADYDLPTHVSNTCMPIVAQANIYPEGTHDFVDEGDAKMILAVPAPVRRMITAYGATTAILYTDFSRLYKTASSRNT